MKQITEYKECFIPDIDKILKKINVLRIENGLQETNNPLGLAELQELWDAIVKVENVNPRISELKKRIKYCKNPMEKKMLQQKLNAAYKEQKRKR